MNRERIGLVLIFYLILGAAGASLVHAQSFSVSGGGPTAVHPDDIFHLGPAVIISGAFPTDTIEVDAFSYGKKGTTIGDISALQFSVDPASTGSAAELVLEALPIPPSGPQAHADIFETLLPSGTNKQVYDGDGAAFIIAPGPPIGLIEVPSTGPTDNVDGYDVNVAPALGGVPGLIWWSVGPGAAVASPASLSSITAGGDILVDSAVTGYTLMPALYVSGSSFLDDPADDIDALIVLEDGVDLGGAMSAGDCIIYSLSRSSPSVISITHSPADILAYGGGCLKPGDGTVTPWLFAPAILLGLLPTDNVDALDIPFVPTAVTLAGIETNRPDQLLPVQVTAVLLVLVLSTFLIWNGRRKRDGL